jgi:hypothetical protein
MHRTFALQSGSASIVAVPLEPDDNNVLQRVCG